jgi:hypothetical protein
MLEPAARARTLATRGDSGLDAPAAAGLAATHRSHARCEERAFLPLSQQILSRNTNQVVALVLSLHMRHVLPNVLARHGSRI